MTPLEELVEAAIAAFDQAIERDDLEVADRYMTLALVLAEYRQLKGARS
jgi:hypothetical protein